MISKTQSQTPLLTGTRLTLTTLAAALVLIVASSCKSNDTDKDTSVATGNRTVTVTSSPAKAPPAGTAQQQQQRQAPADSLAPEVMTTEIKSLDGQKFRLSDFKDKVVVLDLWATWCGPCRMEIPHLVDLSKEYGSKGVQVIGLTTENPEEAEQVVRDFAREFKINYKIGWAERNLAIALMRGNYSIPQTFVIAPGGRLVAHFPGYSDALPAKIRSAISQATEGQPNGGNTTGD